MGFRRYLFGSFCAGAFLILTAGAACSPFEEAAGPRDGDGDSGSTDAAKPDRAPTPCTGDAATCPRYAFVTSAAFKPSALGGIAGADGLCVAAASAIGAVDVIRERSPTFRAWLSVTGSDAAKRFVNDSRPVTRSDGEVIATSWATFIDGSLDFSLSFSELGTAVPVPSLAWTGSSFEGKNDFKLTCGGWTVESGPGRVGDPYALSSDWTDQTDAPCTEAHRLYCIEK